MAHPASTPQRDVLHRAYVLEAIAAVSHEFSHIRYAIVGEGYGRADLARMA